MKAFLFVLHFITRTFALASYILDNVILANSLLVKFKSLAFLKINSLLIKSYKVLLLFILFLACIHYDYKKIINYLHCKHGA